MSVQTHAHESLSYVADGAIPTGTRCGRLTKKSLRHLLEEIGKKDCIWISAYDRLKVCKSPSVWLDTFSHNDYHRKRKERI